MPFREFLRPKIVAVAVSGAGVSGLAMATVTALYPNPMFTRMTPVRTQDWVFLGITVLLIGVLAATYVMPAAPAACENRIAAGGLLNVLAIGCPICNKVVVMLLGLSGALTYWAPIQPLVAVGGIALLAWALRLRLTALNLPLRPQLA
ncbi:MAG: hypothetical protein ACYDGR_05245 [Candidatus Dormibacteria bacterium]